MSRVDIIIPTINNENFVYPCVRSILANTERDLIGTVFVVNNGNSLQKMKDYENPLIKVLDQGQNRGWQGGLQAGLAVSESPFVLFMNDDTFVPPSSVSWLSKLLSHFNNKKIGAVGPCSNSVPGFQDMGLFFDGCVLKVPFLIGFCMLLDRNVLEISGGVDTSLKYGDDIDLSFRIRKQGYELIVDRQVFVFHHGGVTGKRIHSDYDSEKTLSDMCDTLSVKYGRQIVEKEYKAPKCEVLV